MRTTLLAAVIFFGLATLSEQAAAARETILPRRAALGVALAAPADGGQGVIVRETYAGQTAETLGIRAGDTIVTIGGRPAESIPAVVAYAATLRAGDPVSVTIRRDGVEQRLGGRALARPPETYPAASVDYGAVKFRDGYLRDILAMPTRAASSAPVLFLIPGFSCASIEPPVSSHPYRRLGEAMLKEGIGYYRVEKPGLGDSIGSTKCTDIDYSTELEAFRAGYRHLVDVRRVNPDRIFFFGHSLGGLQAPMLAAERAPRGVAVFGTVLRNWGDYHHNVATFQGFLMGGDDPVERAARAERLREVFRRYYVAGEAPKAIAAQVPDGETAVREAIAWDGGERTMGRHYKFMQELAKQPLYAAWRDSRTNVLSLYGEADLVALFDEDHRMIAEIANYYRPGSGRYVEIARTDHGMTLVGTRDEFRRKTAETGTPPSGEFNPHVGSILAQWIRESMARPPVRTLPDRPRPARPETNAN